MKRIFFLLICSILPIAIQGMSVQEKKQVVAQLEHDLMSWESRAQGIEAVKYWAAGGILAAVLAEAALWYYFNYCKYEWRGMLWSQLNRGFTIAMNGEKMCGTSLFLSFLASKYISGLTNELKLKIERLTQEAQPEEA